MSEKALRMLKHMRVQIRMQGIQGTRAASVWGAARSIGLKPEEGEFDALLKELLRGGYIEPYPSPSLAAHGLYRLTDLGISAADEADIAPLRYGRVSGGRTAPPLVADSIRRRIGGACRTIRLDRTRRGY